MNTRQMIAETARRLPGLHKRDVQNVLEELFELWHDELVGAEGELHLRGLGTLYVEVHPLRAGGITRQALLRRYGKNAPTVVSRRTIRFRPYEPLKNALRGEGDDRE